MDEKIASIPKAMVQDVIRMSELMTELNVQVKNVLVEMPMLGFVIEEMTSCLSRVSSLAKNAQILQPNSVGSPSSVVVDAPSKKRKINSGVERRSGVVQGRSSGTCWKTIRSKTMDDGQTWRKYGQKYIHCSKNPRGYFKCTHKNDQGCEARKQVQASEDDSSTYIIKYFGKHTCKNPSDLPQILPIDYSNNKNSCLISFGNIGKRPSEAPGPSLIAAMPPLKDENYCTDEEAMNSNMTDNANLSPCQYFMFPEVDDEQGLSAMFRDMDDKDYQFELENGLWFSEFS